MSKERIYHIIFGTTVSCAIYFINRSPIKILRNCTPREAWYGKKLNVHHLKVFRCVAYSHISVSMRNKLDDTSVFLLDIVKEVKHTGCVIR